MNMKILVAPDSFKDSLTAFQVTQAVKEGIHAYDPSIQVIALPMADGGEGTVQALIDGTNGKLIETVVCGPLFEKTNSFYGILGDGKTAVIEMAAASGIEKLSAKERNPWNTTTFGTGELILKALEQGCTKVILGIGGSATNDAGIGACAALGIEFLDSNGKEVIPTGGGIKELTTINVSKANKLLKNVEIEIACDVSNPLVGEKGASAVYGPQKGADSEMVKQLDANLAHYAKLVLKVTGIDISNYPGTGAAGGLGAGLMAFFNAKLVNGFSIIAKTTRLEDVVKQVDLVITGEGKIDEQTQYGKTPMGVCEIATKYNKPVIAIAGTLGSNIESLYTKGFNGIFSVVNKPMTLTDALNDAYSLVKQTSESIIRGVKCL
jgi:glycerate kinase